MNNKCNMNTYLMYNFKWTKMSEVHCTYKDCTILGSTHRHRQVQLYNVCTILACSSRPEESKRTLYVHSKFSRVEPRKAKCTYIVQSKFSGWQVSRTFFLLLLSAKYNVQSPFFPLYNQRGACTKHSQAIVHKVQPQKISIFGLYNKFNFSHRSSHGPIGHWTANM